jgi:lipopolysaccharide export system permease protein
VVALSIPSHLYELLPITVLIGTIFVMARFAQSSEYTILRTSGLGPWRALLHAGGAGRGVRGADLRGGRLPGAAVRPCGQLLKARYQGVITIGQTGAWLKEKQVGSSSAANVGALTARWQHEEHPHLRVRQQRHAAVHRAG